MDFTNVFKMRYINTVATNFYQNHKVNLFTCNCYLKTKITRMHYGNFGKRKFLLKTQILYDGDNSNLAADNLSDFKEL